MTLNDSGERAASENPRWTAVSADGPALAEWRRRSAEAFAPPLPSPRLLQDDLRGYEEALAGEVFAHSGTLKERAHTLHTRSKALGREAVAIQPGWWEIFRDWGKDDPPPPAPPPPPDGYFWWAQTQPTGNDGGIKSLFLSDGLHFFGGINYDADPTIHRFVGAIATFELHANRRPPSNFGRWRSAPFVELFGQIKGFTGVKIFPIAMDDKWCKCRLNLRQTAFQLTAGGPVVLANHETNTVLLDEENEARWNFRNLDGFTPMPMVEFGLADPNLSVFVDHDVRFDIELEGDSSIVFVPGGNPMGSVLLRTFQWQVQAL